VAGALLLKILKSAQVHLMYMDTGLMRKNETEDVRIILEKLGAKNVHIIMCENEFLSALKGITDPEQKRKVIGDMFITVQEREINRLGLPEDYFLAQGSIKADFVESGITNAAASSVASATANTGAGSGADVINKAPAVKSHHNVASPLVVAKRKAGKIIEPLAELYKDDVRKLGAFLGVDEKIIGRHPFPGPGLAVRILGEVTKEKCGILRDADAVFIEELKSRRCLPKNGEASGKTLYEDIWQAFAVLLPVRSVGVTSGVKQGVGSSGTPDSASGGADSGAISERKYGWVLVLRAVNSADGMTASVYPFETRDLLEISARITDSVKEIGRVTYDISGKPPATIEWE